MQNVPRATLRTGTEKVFTEKITHMRAHTHTHTHPYIHNQTHDALAAGNSRADVLSLRFLSHPSCDLSTPGSMSQAGRALSVTDPLDSSDKDEDDI